MTNIETESTQKVPALAIYYMASTKANTSYASDNQMNSPGRVIQPAYQQAQFAMFYLQTSQKTSTLNTQ